MRLVPDADATTHDELGHQVRASLHRFADDVAPHQPGWTDLIAHVDTVTPLHGRDGHGDPAPRRHLPRRPSFVAAAVLAALLAGGMVARGGSDGADLDPVPASITAAAPTDAGFDAATAPAVWISGADDPVAAARSYLAAMGLPAAPAPGAPEEVVLSLADEGEATAVVEWALRGGPDSSAGTVFLRAVEEGGRRTWAIVGSGARDVELADVRYDGETLSFGIAPAAARDGQVRVSVWIDGESVPLGGGVPPAGAVPTAEPSDTGVGELIDLGAAAAGRSVEVALDEGSTAVVRLQHLVDGRVASVTEMALGLGGKAEAGGAVTAAPDGTTADAGARAGAGATGDATVSPDGPELPADGVPGLPSDEGELRETVGSIVPTTLPPAGELPALPTPPPPTPPTLPTTTEGSNPLGLP